MVVTLHYTTKKVLFSHMEFGKHRLVISSEQSEHIASVYNLPISFLKEK